MLGFADIGWDIGRDSPILRSPLLDPPRHPSRPTPGFEHHIQETAGHDTLSDLQCLSTCHDAPKKIFWLIREASRNTLTQVYGPVSSQLSLRDTVGDRPTRDDTTARIRVSVQRSRPSFARGLYPSIWWGIVQSAWATCHLCILRVDGLQTDARQ